MAEHKIDLAAIRARLEGVERLLAEELPLRGGERPLLRWYVEDVTALLAALDEKGEHDATTSR